MPDLPEKLLRWGRVIIGGPLGVLAWSISGFSALAILLWGLSTVAIPLLMLKTASWGIWGFGVLRESKMRPKVLEKPESLPPPPDSKP
jgi:hypothetical protein